jgi:hypothetical protein
VLEKSETYGEVMTWSPQAPRYRLLHVLVSWLVAGVAVFVAAAIVPHVSVGKVLMSWRHALHGAELASGTQPALPAAPLAPTVVANPNDHRRQPSRWS